MRLCEKYVISDTFWSAPGSLTAFYTAFTHHVQERPEMPRICWADTLKPMLSRKVRPPHILCHNMWLCHIDCPRFGL